MRKLRARRPFATWIAVVALLLASLVPALSHALDTGRAGGWIEVCTGHGTQWVQADPQDPADAPAAAHTLEHCPGCVSHAPDPGLPPSMDSVPGLLALPQPEPRAFLLAPRTLHAWTTAQQRGPPNLA